MSIAGVPSCWGIKSEEFKVAIYICSCLHLEFNLVWAFHFAGGFSFLEQASDMWFSFSFGDVFNFSVDQR